MVGDFKQRIVGGIVIISVFAIFLPILLHRPSQSPTQSISMAIPQPQAVSQMSLELAPSSPDTVAAKITESQQQVVTPVSASISTPALSKEPINKKILQAVVTPPQAWVVQLGSFAEPKNAQHLIQQLRQHGFDAYTRQVTSGSHRITQVFVGPDINPKSIAKTNEKLSHEFHLKGVVRKYQV